MKQVMSTKEVLDGSTDAGDADQFGSAGSSRTFQARHYPWSSFCEGIADIEQGYTYYPRLYKRNFGKHLPKRKDAKILVVSAGPGYFVDYLTQYEITMKFMVLHMSQIAQWMHRPRNCLHSLIKIMMGMCHISSVNCSMFPLLSKIVRLLLLRFLSEEEIKPVLDNLHPSDRYYAKQQAEHTISEV